VKFKVEDSFQSERLMRASGSELLEIGQVDTLSQPRPISHDGGTHPQPPTPTLVQVYTAPPPDLRSWKLHSPRSLIGSTLAYVGNVHRDTTR
jgi:hypothetical protein